MSLGFHEILLIILVILILFGAKRIQELAKALGRAQYEYKKAKTTLEKEAQEFQKSVENEEKSAEIQQKDEAKNPEA